MRSYPEFDTLVDDVLPERLEHEVVWHYTSPAVAELIIQNRAFWATSVVTMNDTDEMLYGMRFVKQRWDERGISDYWERIDGWIFRAEQELAGERLSDSYILCASRDQDSVRQWDRYGYCALGIATYQLMTKVPNTAAVGGRLAPTFTSGWRPVIYDEVGQNLQVARLFSVLEDLCVPGDWKRGDAENRVDRAGIECVLRSIVYLKSDEFVAENEVRLYGQAKPTGALTKPHPSGFGESSHISVRSSPNGRAGDELPLVAVRIADVNATVSGEAAALEMLLAEEDVRVDLVVTRFRKAPVIPARQ